MRLSTPYTVKIHDLTQDGRGVAYLEGKTVFITGALPEEEIVFQYAKRRSNFDEGVCVEILRPSPDRRVPPCPHFSICGGCMLQHYAVTAQVAAKEKALLEQLSHFGQIEPGCVLPALYGPEWGYRRKARLGVHFSQKQGTVKIGFREKSGRFLVNIDHCHVLHPKIAHALPSLQSMIGTLKARQALPQIEVALGEDATALVFRHVQPLVPADLDALVSFGQQHNFCIYLQPKGPDTVHKVWPQDGSDFLSYHLPKFGLAFKFHPLDFIQVNAVMNAQLIDKIIELLAIQPSDHLLELFCGIGNFTLPLARFAERVVGIEGDPVMVARAKENALHNRVDNCDYYSANLQGVVVHAPWMQEKYTKLLLDPPRTGAYDVITQCLPLLNVSTIVYVSCHPATFARDAGILVHTHGFKLISVGVLDMFPHTLHVESIALFQKENG